MREPDAKWELLVRPGVVLEKFARQRRSDTPCSCVPATAVLPGTTITGVLYLPSELFHLAPRRCLSLEVANLHIAIAFIERHLARMAEEQATLEGAADAVQALIKGTFAATHRN